MKRILILASLLAGLAVAAPARAVTISFNPTTSIADVGDIVDVDVVLSGLEAFEELLSAYDLDVTYDSDIVTATNVTFGPFLGGPGEVLEDFNLSLGRIDFAAISLLSDQELDALQGDSIVIATLSFLAVAPGVSPLNFDELTPPGVFLISRGAIPIDPSIITVQSGEIIVRRPVVGAPEPSGLWLGLLGLLATRALRRRR